jgi:hypothetical protein
MPKARKSGRFAPLATAILLMNPDYQPGQLVFDRYQPENGGFPGLSASLQRLVRPLSVFPAEGAVAG